MTDLKAQKVLLEKIEAGEPTDTIDFYNAFRSHYILAERAFLNYLDAARALHEAVLPSSYWGVRSHGISCIELVIRGRSRSFRSTISGSPARAWLICILQALIAEQRNLVSDEETEDD